METGSAAPGQKREARPGAGSFRRTFNCGHRPMQSPCPQRSQFRGGVTLSAPTILRHEPDCGMF